MKKFIPLLIIAIFAVSCAKEDTASDCYECKNIGGNPDYQSVGCMSSDEWNNAAFIDGAGNPLEKLTNCRKKY